MFLRLLRLYPSKPAVHSSKKKQKQQKQKHELNQTSCCPCKTLTTSTQFSRRKPKLCKAQGLVLPTSDGKISYWNPLQSQKIFSRVHQNFTLYSNLVGKPLWTTVFRNLKMKSEGFSLQTREELHHRKLGRNERWGKKPSLLVCKHWLAAACWGSAWTAQQLLHYRAGIQVNYRITSRMKGQTAHHTLQT